MRLVICDDHRLLLEALSSAVAIHGYTVEAATSTPGEAVAAVRLHAPDLLLLDLTFPDGDGLEAAREVVRLHPRTKVVVLTASEALEPLHAALEIGVAGYIRKDQRLPQIVGALDRIGRGERVFDETLVRRLGRLGTSVPRQFTALDRLTAREWDIVRLLEEGLSTREIVTRLGISNSTVRCHIQAILSKLCVHSRLQAVAFIVEADVPVAGAAGSVRG